MDSFVVKIHKNIQQFWSWAGRYFGRCGLGISWNTTDHQFILSLISFIQLPCCSSPWKIARCSQAVLDSRCPVNRADRNRGRFDYFLWATVSREPFWIDVFVSFILESRPFICNFSLFRVCGEDVAHIVLGQRTVPIFGASSHSAYHYSARSHSGTSRNNPSRYFFPGANRKWCQQWTRPGM